MTNPIEKRLVFINFDHILAAKNGPLIITHVLRALRKRNSSGDHIVIITREAENEKREKLTALVFSSNVNRYKTNVAISMTSEKKGVNLDYVRNLKNTVNPKTVIIVDEFFNLSADDKENFHYIPSLGTYSHSYLLAPLLSEETLQTLKPTIQNIIHKQQSAQEPLNDQELRTLDTLYKDATTYKKSNLRNAIEYLGLFAMGATITVTPFACTVTYIGLELALLVTLSAVVITLITILIGHTAFSLMQRIDEKNEKIHQRDQRAIILQSNIQAQDPEASEHSSTLRQSSSPSLASS